MLVGVEPHVLRYWESEFPTIRPQKSRSGQRVYSRRDVEKLLRVKDLLYAQRFTIAGARQRLRGPTDEARLLVATATPVQPKATESSADVAVHAVVGGAVQPEHRNGTPSVTATVPNDGNRAAVAAMRSALLALREQIVEMLERAERGSEARGS